jgi:hypothetical protein
MEAIRTLKTTGYEPGRALKKAKLMPSPKSLFPTRLNLSRESLLFYATKGLEQYQRTEPQGSAASPTGITDSSGTAE